MTGIKFPEAPSSTGTLPWIARDRQGLPQFTQACGIPCLSCQWLCVLNYVRKLTPHSTPWPPHLIQHPDEGPPGQHAAYGSQDQQWQGLDGQCHRILGVERLHHRLLRRCIPWPGSHARGERATCSNFCILIPVVRVSGPGALSTVALGHVAWQCTQILN